MPTSSGVWSSSEINGRSWTSRPMQWPVRCRNHSPRPASTITSRVGGGPGDTGSPRAHGPDTGSLFLHDHVVDMAKVIGGPAHLHRPAEVGAVAVDHRGEIERNGEPGLDGPSRQPNGGVPIARRSHTPYASVERR